MGNRLVDTSAALLMTPKEDRQPGVDTWYGRAQRTPPRSSPTTRRATVIRPMMDEIRPMMDEQIVLTRTWHRPFHGSWFE